MRIKFFIKNKEIKKIKLQIIDLNNIILFSQHEKNILKPIYINNLDQLEKKILPFGLYIIFD